MSRAAKAKPISQAAVVAVQRGRVCLITSSSGRRWLLPKGKRQAGCDLRETARREAWEEAGLVGRVAGTPLGSYQFTKYGCRHTVVVFRMRVTAAKNDWPERRKRLRQWVRPGAALDRLHHPDLCTLLRDVLSGNGERAA
jgi:8-oxo-dGTP pyrophosphatase MutT (NUDIX family)